MMLKHNQYCKYLTYHLCCEDSIYYNRNIIEIIFDFLVLVGPYLGLFSLQCPRSFLQYFLHFYYYSRVYLFLLLHPCCSRLGHGFNVPYTYSSYWIVLVFRVKNQQLKRCYRSFNYLDHLTNYIIRYFIYESYFIQTQWHLKE